MILLQYYFMIVGIQFYKNMIFYKRRLELSKIMVQTLAKFVLVFLEFKFLRNFK